MGIHTTVDLFEADEIDADLAALADDMLAQILREHTRERFREANRANRDVAGDWIAYTVTVDGQTYSGRGEIFPEHQIAAFRPQYRSGRERQREANVQFGRKLRDILIEWLWAKASRRLLEQAIRTLLRAWRGGERIDAALSRGASADGLLRAILQSDATGLLAWLIEQWAWSRSWYVNLQDARTAWQVLRLAHTTVGVVGEETAPDDDRTDDVLRWIARALIDRSPVLSGAYRSAHMLLADGDEVASAEDVAAGATIPRADEYVFLNAQPYARKIEVGKTRDGRDFVVQVPPLIYERTAEDATARFGVPVRSQWRTDSGGAAPTRNRDRALRFPALVVRIR